MELTKELWQKCVVVCNEIERRNEVLSRYKIKDLLEVSDRTAGYLLFAYENRQILNYNPSLSIKSKIKEICINDIHIPYQDKLAIVSVNDFIADYKPNLIVLNGDIIDFYQASTFAKNPQNKSISYEIEQTKLYLTELRNANPDARIIYKQGNHEDRLQRYLMSKASEIYDLVNDLYQTKVGLTELNIEYVVEPFKIGNLWHLHGHEKPGGSYNPEYITNVLWQYINNHFICGHYHRNQEKVFKRALDKETFWGGAVGYLAGDLDYATLNKWSQGFATIEYINDKHFKPTLFNMENGVIL